MKDRLEEFQKAVSAKNGKSRGMVFTKDVEDGIINNYHEPSPSESTEFLKQDDWNDLDKFLALVNDLRQKIGQLEMLTTEMKDIHGRILVVPNADPQDTKMLAAVIDNFTILSKSVNTLIKKLNEEASEFEKKSTGAEARIRRDQVNVLNRSIRNALIEFNNEQVRYKEKCRTRMHNYLKIADNEMNEEEMDAAIESGQFFSTKSVMLGDRDKKLLYEDIKNRHEDIIKLENAIKELHEMFQDIAMLIESQGEVLNNIEKNVTNAAEYANKAHKDVTQARAAKQRNMKLKVAICLCSIILIILLLIFGAGAFCFYLPFICR